jgi:hypothetical protein
MTIKAILEHATGKKQGKGYESHAFTQEFAAIIVPSKSPRSRERSAGRLSGIVLFGERLSLLMAVK